MSNPKENDQYVKAVEYSHTLEKLLIMERENISALRNKLEDTERERDEAIAEHRKHAASLLADRGLLRQRAEAAEAELARRDAAACDPVAWQYRYNYGKVGDWKTVDSDSECNHSPCYERRAIYTAAPPAVLPPAISTDGLDPESRDIDDVRNLAHIVGANWMRQQCLELGAQQQKVVELPDPADDSLMSTWQFKDAVINALDAVGVKWEVKK